MYGSFGLSTSAKGKAGLCGGRPLRRRKAMEASKTRDEKPIAHVRRNEGGSGRSRGLRSIFSVRPSSRRAFQQPSTPALGDMRRALATTRGRVPKSGSATCARRADTMKMPTSKPRRGNRSIPLLALIWLRRLSGRLSGGYSHTASPATTLASRIGSDLKPTPISWLMN